MKREKVIEKLIRMIRIQQSANDIGSYAEAEAFAEKIQQLMDEYSIEVNELQSKETDSLFTGLVDMGITKDFERSFLIRITKLNGVGLVFSQRGFVLLAGDPFCVHAVVEIYKYFRELGRHLWSIHLKTIKSTTEFRRKRLKARYLNDHRFAYYTGIFARIAARMESSQASTAIAVVGDKLSRADQHIKDNFDTEKTKIKSRKLNVSSLLAGVRDGDSVALTTKTVQGR